MFSFFTPPIEFDTDTVPVRIARVKPGLKDVKSLVTALGAGLDFPKFAGKNWDALWDSIRDLSEDLPLRIVVTHDDLPALPPEDLATYLQLLRDAVVYWHEYPDEHLLEVWFPMQARDKIRAIVKDMPPPEDVE